MSTAALTPKQKKIKDLDTQEDVNEKCKVRSVGALIWSFQLVLTIIGIYFICVDVNLGLSTSNSKFVSLVHSLDVCYNYRKYRKTTFDYKVKWKQFYVSAMCKFAGGNKGFT